MKDTYVETTDNTLKNYRDFRAFYIEIFIIMSAINICDALRNLVPNAQKRRSNGWPKRRSN